MIIERIIFERDHPKEERPGSTLTDKSKTIYRVIIEAWDSNLTSGEGGRAFCNEERTIQTPGDESAILSEILLALATKIRPAKPNTQRPQ